MCTSNYVQFAGPKVMCVSVVAQSICHGAAKFNLERSDRNAIPLCFGERLPTTFALGTLVEQACTETPLKGLAR